ncbi:MAG: hypothetical protein NTW67_00875 [Candidatus Woesearchaeota archaeon]|nr:hypothetical protein [Candidatus Woesearchaeota archaeon]
MPLKQPESVDECVYFTRRTIDKGHVMCWAFKEKCPKCGKALVFECAKCKQKIAVTKKLKEIGKKDEVPEED